jgi:hypothetical protein
MAMTTAKTDKQTTTKTKTKVNIHVLSIFMCDDPIILIVYFKKETRIL